MDKTAVSGTFNRQVSIASAIIIKIKSNLLNMSRVRGLYLTTKENVYLNILRGLLS